MRHIIEVIFNVELFKEILSTDCSASDFSDLTILVCNINSRIKRL